MPKTIRAFKILTEFHKLRRKDKKFARKWSRFDGFAWAREKYKGYKFTYGKTYKGGE